MVLKREGNLKQSNYQNKFKTQLLPMGRFETKRDAQKTKRITSKQSGLQENKKDFYKTKWVTSIQYKTNWITYR